MEVVWEKVGKARR